VLGANGQLGSDLCLVLEEAGYEVVPLTHESVEVRYPDSIRGALNPVEPDLIINTTAYHNLSDCQSNPDLSFAVNACGPLHLAAVARELDAQFVHVSTDYVFDGRKSQPYRETDAANPLNVYGASKLAGEHLAAAELNRHLIVRTSGLFGRMPCRAKSGLNFIHWMLKLARDRGKVRVVTDEIVTPTYTLDLARQIEVAVRNRCCGLVHASSQGQCSWFEFAEAIFEIAEVPVDLQPTKAEAFGSGIRRPSYSVLANERLQAESIDRMPHWRDALARYLVEIGEGPLAA